jgi:hypothetical protein
MADPLVRLTVSIPGPLAAALKQRCLHDRDSLSAVVTDALALHLDELEPGPEPVLTYLPLSAIGGASS